MDDTGEAGEVHGNDRDRTPYMLREVCARESVDDLVFLQGHPF
jgi:hypothetical protein